MGLQLQRSMKGCGKHLIVICAISLMKKEHPSDSGLHLVHEKRKGRQTAI